MSNLSIIGRIAAERIREQLEADGDGPPTRILYGIIDLDDDVTCAIAREIAEVTTEHGKVEVFVHPKIAGDGAHDIGKAQVSDETATYHRGNTTADTALTVFSVPKSDTASVRASLAHVSVINSDWLTDDMSRWAAAGHPKASDPIKDQLANVLDGLKRAGIVSEVKMLSAFVAEVRDLMTGPEGLPVGEAVRRALPALRLPMNSGDRRIAIEQGADKAEAFFRKVFDEHRPALYLRSKGDDSLNAIELRKNLDALEASGDVAAPVAASIRALLSNPDIGAGAWLPEQEIVSRISWDLVEPIFSGVRQKTSATFGEDTLTFFDRRHPGTLTESQKDMLTSLKRDSVRPDDVHQQFFSQYATMLGDEPKLYRRWEKLVYRKPVETRDLQEGLLSLINMTMPEEADDHSSVYVRLRRGDDLNFWTEDKNTRLCRYLRDRYRGLDKLLSPEIVLDFGRCWTYWDGPDFKENTSESKTATSFEFEAFHVPKKHLFDGDGASMRPTADQLRTCPKAQMIWSPKAGAMGLSFSDDLQVLCETGAVVMKTGKVPLLRSVVSANRYDKHGSIQTIDLENQSSINDARHDNNGHFANDKVDENVIDARWDTSLDALLSEGILTAEGHSELRAAFDAFRAAYGLAILAMRRGDGLASKDLIVQGELYGSLLAKLATTASSPRAIRDLWLLLLQVGVAEVTTDRPTVIVCGWNPMRLAEAAAKAAQLAGAMRAIQGKAAGFASEVGPYLRDTVRNLTSSYYMDVGLGVGQSDGTKPELLVETVRSLDLSLLESPRPGEAVIADEPADEIADSFDAVAKDYLRLRPHEKANFNTMLLNSESEGLPVKLAEHMAALMEKEASLRCDLVITHDDAAQLRRIYEQQNRRIGYEVDSALTSEAARNFLSRLRVGIISPDVLDENYGKAHDIVILHSVVSRRADIRWARVAATAEQSFETHVPASHSRKKPFHRGDTTSGTYLTSPSRVPASEAYLDALHGCLTQGAVPGDHWVPLQEVEFQSGAVRDLMNKAHRLAEWVMTYDRIADRRLLANDERRILRYYSSPRSDHNVIISTEINAKKLGERLVKDLKIAIPHATGQEIDEIVAAVHRQSASLSGAVVMRGAERVNHAHELLGLVLARRELEALLRKDAPAEMQRTAWFFIDDFIPWLELGSHRADIMAVNFAKVGGKPLLRVTVGEAKFVSYANMREHKQHSMEQLTSTVATLTRRLSTEHGTIDPLAWRSRIADLVLEHIDPFDHIDGMSFEEWLASLRDGTLPITVSGHSVVYIHDMEEDPKNEAFVPDAEVHPSSQRRLLAQWTYGRPSIAGGFKDLLKDDAKSRLSVPPEWPGNPYAGPLLVVPPAMSDVPEIKDGIATEVASAPVEVEVQAAEPLKEEPFGSTTPEADPEDFEVGEADPVDEAPSAPPHGWLPTVWNALSVMRRSNQTTAGEQWLDDEVDKLRDALQTEGMHAPIIERRLTPNSAVLTLDGSKGVTVAWLEKRQTDLLTRHGVDIGRITPLTGKIAVSINRPKRSVVHLSDAWMKRELEAGAPASNGALVLGETELSGEMLYMPLFGPFGEIPRAAPHTIISGSTGSGKGILASNLILDLCAFNSPDNLKLYMIDPKAGVDYGWMRKLPHLEGEIISDKELALETLAGLAKEMQNRYDKITETDAQNITLYNKLPGVEKMPRIVLFFDEVANWMQDDDFKDRASPIINDIATKSRAAGIHLVMIYQRADNQVMSMQLRTNLGNKLVLRLGDEGSSKVAMGEKGAEKLLGQGHLIAKLDSDEKTYAQVPFLNPEEEIGIVANAIVMGWRAASAGKAE